MLMKEITVSQKNWIERVINKRYCSKFIPNQPGSIRCGCGRLSSDHTNLHTSITSNFSVFGSQYDSVSSITPSATATDGNSDQTWSVSQHTSVTSTDAFGTIEFQGGPHPLKAQYVRLSHDTRPDVVLQLLTRIWQLELPKLLISVHGGKANFQLQPKLKRVLRKGLVKAARTTGAWIFTGGTDTGVTRHVGEALLNERGLVSTTHRNKIVTIGIAPWGIIENRKQLIGKDVEVKYHSITSAKSRYSALNNRHSYFLLIDNGTVGKYGAEISFRKKLEKYISKQKILAPRLTLRSHGFVSPLGNESGCGGYGVPVVCLVIEGGKHTIRCVLESITDIPPIPVVVCDGSGRAADLLAFTDKYTNDNGIIIDSLQEQLMITIDKTFSCGHEQAEQLLVELQQCVSKSELMTVFRLGEGLCQELDQAILTALLKGHRLPVTDQLSLALTWNRADIAASEIFVFGQDWPIGSLDQAMMDALVSDRVDFVKLLLKNGVTMTKFLTIPRLEELYNTRDGPSNTLSHLVKDVKKNMPRHYHYTLYDIGLVIEKLMGGAFRSSYCRRKFREYYNTIMHRSPTHNNTRRLKSSANLLAINDADSTFMFPFHELLIWAVIMKRQKMALFMWQHGEEALVKALIACKLYKAMAMEAAQDDLEADLYEEMIANALDFEKLALELLDFSYRQDDDMTEQLLTYELQCWSKQTCLSIAVCAGHLAFLAHSASQLLLSDLWMGGLRMRRNTNLKVILGLIFPPTILTLEFKSKEELLQMPQTEEEHIMDRSDSEDSLDNIPIEPLIDVESNSSIHVHYTEVPVTNHNGNIFSPLSKLDEGSDRVYTRQRPLSLGKKISEFYGAPITKFWSHSIAYGAFLLCFTYVVLVKMNPQVPSYPECYVMAFLLTMGMEKTRELMSSEAVKFYSKLMVWFEKKWNPCDACAIGVFMIGVSLRLTAENHSEGRVLYCINIIYWYIRILDILGVNKYLGPYVTMIGKMVVNMIYFVVLLLVVLLSYGVARQAILFPNEEPSWLLIRHIFFQPYFMLYGEVFADKIDPDCGDGEGQSPCHSGSWINPLVMSVYLLVANILLINLLIAVFNNIFQEVNAISRQVWKFQRFSVVMEYESKPVLPPPLIIFSHIRILYRYCYRHWKGKPWVFDHGLKLFLSDEEVERIHDFEEECVEGYFREKEMKLQMSTAEQVRVTCERVELMSHRIEDINQREKEAKVNLQSLEFRLGQLEELTQQTVSSMSVIHRFMSNHISDLSPLITMSASSTEPQPSELFGEANSKNLKPKCDTDDYKESVSPSKVTFVTPVIEEEETADLDTESSHHSLVSPFADRKLMLRSSLLQRRLHRSKRQDTDAESCVGTPDESNDKDQMTSDRPPLSKTIGRIRRASSTQSEPEKTSCHSPPRRPKVERSISTVTWQQLKSTPSIIVMPATPRPHIIKAPLITEYTSITDELENQACLVAHLAPPSLESPTISAKRPHISRHSSSEIEEATQALSDVLHDAEATDYQLMEGLIQRRLHRDSENLTESIEDLCHLDSEMEENSESEENEEHTIMQEPGSSDETKTTFYLPESKC